MDGYGRYRRQIDPVSNIQMLPPPYIEEAMQGLLGDLANIELLKKEESKEKQAEIDKIIDISVEDIFGGDIDYFGKKQDELFELSKEVWGKGNARDISRDDMLMLRKKRTEIERSLGVSRKAQEDYASLMKIYANKPELYEDDFVDKITQWASTPFEKRGRLPVLRKKVIPITDIDAVKDIKVLTGDKFSSKSRDAGIGTYLSTPEGIEKQRQSGLTAEEFREKFNYLTKPPPRIIDRDKEPKIKYPDYQPEAGVYKMYPGKSVLEGETFGTETVVGDLPSSFSFSGKKVAPTSIVIIPFLKKDIGKKLVLKGILPKLKDFKKGDKVPERLLSQVNSKDIEYKAILNFNETIKGGVKSNWIYYSGTVKNLLDQKLHPEQRDYIEGSLRQLNKSKSEKEVEKKFYIIGGTNYTREDLIGLGYSERQIDEAIKAGKIKVK